MTHETHEKTRKSLITRYCFRGTIFVNFRAHSLHIFAVMNIFAIHRFFLLVYTDPMILITCPNMSNITRSNALNIWTLESKLPMMKRNTRRSKSPTLFDCFSLPTALQ